MYREYVSNHGYKACVIIWKYIMVKDNQFS